MGNDVNDVPTEWNGDHVRRLRGYLGDTQSEFAERLGTRQQTVSEWETGASRPRRMSRRLLHLLAEERGYYSAARDSTAGGGEAGEAGEADSGAGTAREGPE